MLGAAERLLTTIVGIVEREHERAMSLAFSERIRQGGSAQAAHDGTARVGSAFVVARSAAATRMVCIDHSPGSDD